MSTSSRRQSRSGHRAVQAEFARYIESCDPAKTCQRLQRFEAEMIRREGFVGLGL